MLLLPFKAMLLKSCGPPLLAPSLKVQGDDTHTNSGFSVI
jgi:hypothetical protein